MAVKIGNLPSLSSVQHAITTASASSTCMAITSTCSAPNAACRFATEVVDRTRKRGPLMNEPLAKLETGRELDIAVAKEVLQWTQREKSWRTPGGRFRRRPWLVSWLVGDDYWLLSEVRRTWDPQRLKTFDAWLCVP